MMWLKHFLFHNWHLKLFSLILATMLWMTIARESVSEIGIEVPLEYQNVPANTEVISDTTNVVEVRLRGPSALIREISPQEISTAINLADMEQGTEKIVPLTAQHVRTPVGTEVVGVIPARVRVTLEPTLSMKVPVRPVLNGVPAAGFHVDKVSVLPEYVTVEGPASRVRLQSDAPTTPVDVSDKHDLLRESVDLDISDPLVRVPRSEAIRVEVHFLPDPDRKTSNKPTQ